MSLFFAGKMLALALYAGSFIFMNISLQHQLQAELSLVSKCRHVDDKTVMHITFFQPVEGLVHLAG
jgi:hypothetical protein